MAIINGTPGNDILPGTSADDILSGLGGNDSLSGFGGDDLLDGDDGSDTLNGGNGNDVLDGGDGSDILNGGEGSDLLNGENGSDTLFGGNGNDNLLGGDGSDNLLGGNGNDNLLGGNGADNLSGGDGSDVLSGGDGSDVLNGGNDNDNLFGGRGDDIVLAGRGNDNLAGGRGNDLLLGGRGDDNLDGGEANDILDGGNGNDSLVGGNGDDAVIGGAGRDTLDGGNGNDVLVGGGGSRLLGLTDNNALVSFDAASPDQTTTIQVNGVDGKLIGIDVRPANGVLYGVTDSNKIYTINPDSGQATLVSNISPIPFNAGQQSGVDFNPVPDRLRLNGSNDQNLRVNVDNGMVADGNPNVPGVQPDGMLAYAAGDPNFGKDPNITAAAYTNAFPGGPSPTRTTQLLTIDFGLDALVLQNPPNAGTLNTIGSLGVDFGPTAGFDIFSPANGVNIGYAVTGSSLYNINLATGAATSLGTVGNGSFNFIGLAAVNVPDSGSNGRDILQGGNGNDTLIGGASNDTVTGGAGTDSFQFATPTEGIDTITDFLVVDDTIIVSASGFGGGLVAGAAITPDQFTIGSGAVDAADRFIYNSKTGGLFFDVDGTGGMAQMQISSLSTGLLLTNNDIFVAV